MRVEVVRESEKLLQLPRIRWFGESRDTVQFGACEVASVFTYRVSEIFDLRLANPAFFGVELDVLALASFVHLAIVVEKLLFSFTKDDDVIEIALN